MPRSSVPALPSVSDSAILNSAGFSRPRFPQPSPSGGQARVVAVVRNDVTSDHRVLKTCRLVREAGFESHAIGWSRGGVPAFEVLPDGVEVRRTSPGSNGLRSLLLCRAARKGALPLRQVLDRGERHRWIHRELARTGAKTGFDATTIKPPWFRVLYTAEILGARLLPGGSSDRLQTRKMMLFLAETFWDLYPPLLHSGADIIHAHELSALLPAVIAGRQLGVPVVYDSHELEFARNSPWGEDTFAFWTAHERDLIDCVDGIVAVSEGCAQALRQKYKLSRNAVSVVRNCPSECREEAALGVREVIGLSQEVPLLVFVGKLTRNRGLELLLRVLTNLPHFHLACVGSEDPSYRHALEKKAVAEGVRDRISFVPAVPGNSVVPFISQADVSVMPIKDACLSYRYCLPNKLFESAHAGIPIVASALPDMQAFVEHYGIGDTVEGEDPAQWARAIDLVYQRRAAYYTAEKLAWIRRETSAEHEISKLCGLYRQLVSESVILAS